MKEYYNLLTKMPLFENLSLEDIQKMLKCLRAQRKIFTKDAFIRNEGDPADFIGIVLKGAIQVLQYDFNGNRTIISHFSEGEMFAEAISCAEIPTLPFSIQAVTDCEILFINEKQMLHQCDGACAFHNRLIQNLLKIVARKNMLLNQKLNYMSHKTTAEKLLAYLNGQAKLHNSNEFTIPYDRQALADYLGVERSAMAAEIGKLKKQECLKPNVVILNLLSNENFFSPKNFSVQDRGRFCVFAKSLVFDMIFKGENDAKTSSQKK